jgi:TetR/AcrR family transcriptional repressor of mexJK operon
MGRMTEHLQEEGRSARKHRDIMEAATTVFLEKGYLGASMDEVAALAAVSKQTVYKHFGDKERLFTEIILATLDQVDEMIHMVIELPTDDATLETVLDELARQFVTTLIQPRLIQLRRLIIANADRFPELGRTWYQQGFDRVLATLAATFQRLTDDGLLRTEDPLMAAHHFAGLLLWVPLNEAMFAGQQAWEPEELQRHAEAAVRAFLAAYRPVFTPTSG